MHRYFNIVFMIGFIAWWIAGCDQAMPMQQAGSPAASAALSPTQLKYLLIERFGAVGDDSQGVFYCDPDMYPVGGDIASERKRAEGRFPSIRSDTDALQVIAQHLGLDKMTQFSAEQKLRLYREYKKLQAIDLQPKGDTYTFRLGAGDSRSKTGGFAVTGTINKRGVVTILKQEETWLMCPICLAENTRIKTPDGEVAVQRLRPGMSVWTTTMKGKRVPGTILRVTRVPVSIGHELIDLALDDGRKLIASPRHPLADGRTLDMLVINDRVDGAKVIRVEWVTTKVAATYDILPSGATRQYWANGILMRSTLTAKTNN